MTEYDGAKTLATIEYAGLTFQVVRRRVNGKPWRKYLALLYNGTDMTRSSTIEETDPVKGAAIYKQMLERAFRGDKTSLLKRIEYVKDLYERQT